MVIYLIILLTNKEIVSFDMEQLFKKGENRSPPFKQIVVITGVIQRLAQDRDYKKAIKEYFQEKILVFVFWQWLVKTNHHTL